MICNRPMDICMRNLWKERRNGERMPVLILVPGSHEHLTLRKCVMCARNMGAHVRHGIRSMKGIRTGCAKKLVSSNVAKMLEKESSNKN
jgi:hypothetical protein